MQIQRLNYEQKVFLFDVYQKLDNAEEQLAQGKIMKANSALKCLRGKYGI